MADTCDFDAGVEADRAQSQPHHCIDIEHVARNDRGPVWRALHNGKVLIDKTRIPALDACRCLLGIGKTGKLGMYRNGELQLGVNIEKGAGLTVVDSQNRGPLFGPFKNFAGEGEEEGEDMAMFG